MRDGKIAGVGLEGDVAAVLVDASHVTVAVGLDKGRSGRIRDLGDGFNAGSGATEDLHPSCDVADKGVVIDQGAGVERRGLAAGTKTDWFGDLVASVNLGRDEENAGIALGHEDIVAEFNLLTDVEDSVVRHGLIIPGAIGRRRNGHGRGAGVARSG